MSQDKKEHILLAASECFARFGYKKTTLEDIGQKIGLNKASIYYYFKNKEEIFTTLILNEFEQFMFKLHQEIEEDMDCEDKIFMYFEKKLRYFQKSMILQQITEIELEKLEQLISTGQEISLKLENEEKEFIMKILEKCIKDGYIKDCNTEKVSVYLFSLVNGIKHNCLEFSTMKYPNIKYPTAIEFDNLIQDIQTALKIFINGLK